MIKRCFVSFLVYLSLFNGCNIQNSKPLLDEIQSATYQVPDLKEFVITDDKNYIEFTNSEENKYPIYYLLTRDVGHRVACSFESNEEALAYIQENQQEYVIKKENNLYWYFTEDDIEGYSYKTCFYVEKSENSFDVIEYDTHLVYRTVDIKPGETVEWDVTKYLVKGDYDIRVEIGVESFLLENYTQEMKIIIE